MVLNFDLEMVREIFFGNFVNGNLKFLIVSVLFLATKNYGLVLLKFVLFSITISKKRPIYTKSKKYHLQKDEKERHARTSE